MNSILVYSLSCVIMYYVKEGDYFVSRYWISGMITNIPGKVFNLQIPRFERRNVHCMHHDVDDAEVSSVAQQYSCGFDRDKERWSSKLQTATYCSHALVACWSSAYKCIVDAILMNPNTTHIFIHFQDKT